MLLEAFVIIGGYYLLYALCFYVQGIIKTWEYTGIWNFKIENGYIGICKYPKWSLFWAEWISRRYK